LLCFIQNQLRRLFIYSLLGIHFGLLDVVHKYTVVDLATG